MNFTTLSDKTYSFFMINFKRNKLPRKSESIFSWYFLIYFFFRNNPFAIIIPKEAIKKE
jgi:hypothetical protein